MDAFLEEQGSDDEVVEETSMLEAMNGIVEEVHEEVVRKEEEEKTRFERLTGQAPSEASATNQYYARFLEKEWFNRAPEQKRAPLRTAYRDKAEAAKAQNKDLVMKLRAKMDHAYFSGEYRQAMEIALEICNEQEVGSVEEYDVIARCCTALDDYNTALEFVLRMTSARPHNHSCWMFQGEVYSKLGKSHDAVSAYVKALRITRKDNVAIWLRLCEVLEGSLRRDVLGLCILCMERAKSCLETNSDYPGREVVLANLHQKINKLMIEVGDSDDDVDEDGAMPGGSGPDSWLSEDDNKYIRGILKQTHIPSTVESAENDVNPLSR